MKVQHKTEGVVDTKQSENNTGTMFNRGVEFGKILEGRGVTLSNPQKFNASDVLRTVEAYSSTHRYHQHEFSATIMINKILKHLSFDDINVDKVALLLQAKAELEKMDPDPKLIKDERIKEILMFMVMMLVLATVYTMARV